MGGKGSGRRKVGVIVPGDAMVKIRPLKPVLRKRIKQSRKLSAKSAAWWDTANRAARLKAAGFSLRRIAEELELGANHAGEQKAYYMVKRVLETQAKFNYEEMVALHVNRTEDMLLKLKPGIDKGNPRSVEVAVKVLDRQSELLGLDYEDRKEGEQQVGTVQINILADPRDSEAQRFLSEIATRSRPAEVIEPIQRPVLPPVEGDSL